MRALIFIKVARSYKRLLLVFFIVATGAALYYYSGRYRPVESIEIPQQISIATSLLDAQGSDEYSELINYKGFSLGFDQQTHLARWVAYELTADELKVKRAKRKDRFRKDTIPSILTARQSDYTRSGYDRGHLAPAADMAWDQVAMDQSFFFSNICPQTPNLNRGIWKKLEDQGRKWAIQKSSIYIVTGPVILHPSDSTGNLPIPKYFYKAILVYQEETQQAIGFVMPNAKVVKGNLVDYVVTIDSLELLTDLDLFDKLPQRIEKKVERKVDKGFWFGSLL